MIYLDNAATSLRKPQAVTDAVVEAMQTVGNCGRAAYDEALNAARTVFSARQAVAAFFGCPRADHVVFTANITESLNIALNGLLCPGDHVIATDLEHNSVLRPLYRLEREQGVAVSFVPADRRGQIDYAAFEALLRPQTRLVVTTHASNLTGNVLDIAKIADFCRRHELIYVLDAAQTAGSFPLDMTALGVDVLCFTGHKGLMGPQGTGGLCIREGVEIRPWKVGGTGVQTHLHEQPAQYPTRLEAGTLNAHGIAGLHAALEFLNKTGLETIHAHEERLTRRFYEGVRAIPGVTVYGDFAAPHAAIVTLNLGTDDSSEVADALAQDFGIAVRAGAHCAPRMHDALGTAEQGAVRFSFGWYNTDEEIDAAVAAVRSLAE